MTAFTFVLTSLETGTAVGFALVCVEAHYASVRWLGADRLDRCLDSPANWDVIAQEVRRSQRTPPKSTGDLSTLLLPAGSRQHTLLQCLRTWPVESEADSPVIGMALDALLWATK